MAPLCVLLVEDDSDYAALVLRWLSTTEANRAEFVLSWTDSLTAATARLDQGGVDLVLLDLGLPDSNGFVTFEAIVKRAAGLPIVILSGADDEALALQSIQHGAQDYLNKFSCSAELLTRTIRHTVVRHRSGQSPPLPSTASSRSNLIGVLAASGGSGATTVAAVLAADLRHHADQPTLLMDLDLSPGMVAFTTGVDPQYSVGDALSHVGHLDQSIWTDLIVRRPGNLDVLATARSTADAKEWDPVNVRSLFDFIRGQYQWTVVDLGRLNHFSKQIAPSFDELLLVASPGLPGLHQCKQAIEQLNELGVERDRVRLILNRTEASHRLSNKQIQNLFGITIDATLPTAHEDLYLACLRKRLPAVTSEFRVEIARLARKMAGLDDLQPNRLRLSLSSLTDRILGLGEHSSSSSSNEKPVSSE